MQVVVVGDGGTPGELEDFVAAGRDPMAAVGFSPGHWALGVHLFGNRLELRPVFGSMPIEVVPVLLAIAVADGVIDTHSSVSLDVSQVGTSAGSGVVRDQDGLLGTGLCGFANLVLPVGGHDFVDRRG